MRTLLLGVLLLSPAFAGGLPLTARDAVAGWPLLPAREFRSDLALGVAAVAPDGQESASVCVLGPILRLGYARAGVKVPPCWTWYVENTDFNADDDDVAAIAAVLRAEGVPGLDLRMAGRVTDRGVAPLKGIAGLRYLNLSGTAVTDAGLAALLTLPDLAALDLSRTRVTDAGLANLAKMKGLVALNLNACMGVTGDGIARLEDLDGLAWLGLLQTRADDGAAAALAVLKSLQVLELGQTQVTDKGVKALRKAKALRGLGVSSTAVGDGGLGALQGHEELDLELSRATAKGLAPFKGLRWLSLSGLPVSDDALARWRGAASLLEVDLTDTGAGDKTLAALGRHGRLERLHLKGAGITDRGLRALGGCGGLRALYLSHATSVTDEGIAHLRGLPIEALGLRGCMRLTDASMESVAALGALQWLDLGNVEALTDAGVARLKALAGLRSLDLGGCRKVTAAAIEDLRAALPGLTSLRDPSQGMRGSTPATPVPR